MSDSTFKPVIFLAFANDRDDTAGYLRNLPEEARRLREVLQQAEQADLCEVVVRSNATANDIFKVFQDSRYRNRIALFHYGGHANGYQLLLETAQGESAAADAGGLAAFLGQQRGLQFVFLNGCATRQQSQGLLDANIPAVMTTSRAIDDQVAMDFAAQFYQGLAGGAPLRTAFNEAEASLNMLVGGNTRALYLEGVAASQPRLVDGRCPWELHCRAGSEQADQWSLPQAVNNPLFGLPPLAQQDLPESPYRYLNRFTRNQADVFFGRGQHIRELYNRVTSPHSAPLLLFYGQSGVGKSSVLDAGLIPRLERDFEVVYLRRTAGGLSDTLRLAFLPEVPDAPAEKSWLLKEEQIDKPLIVILDQVEEVYTRPCVEHPDELDQFLQVVQAIFVDCERRPRGKLVLGFRKEWFTDLEMKILEYQLPKSRVSLDPLDRRGIIEVVQGPARTTRLRDQYGLTIEEGLAEMIADDLHADRDSAVAPTLQILLTKMWERARSSDYEHPCFSTELYLKLKREGILLRDFLDQQIAVLSERYPGAVDSGLLLDLIALHTTALGTADQCTIEELQAHYAHLGSSINDLIKQCQDLHLLTMVSGSDTGSRRTTRLAHDTLAPLVRERFEESDKPGQRARRILDNRSVEWGDAKTGPPLDDADLTIVEQGLNGTRTLTEVELRLMESSRRLRAKLQRNRNILMVAGVVVAVICLLGVFGWVKYTEAEQKKKQVERERDTVNTQRIELALQSQKLEESNDKLERQIAVSQAARLAALSLATLERSPLQSLLLAMESVQATTRYGLPVELVARQALRDALAAVGGRGLSGHTDAIVALAISPDNRWLVTGSVDKTARLWDLQSDNPNQSRPPLEGHKGPVNAVALSPDGRWLATGSEDNTARLWDLTLLDDPNQSPQILSGHKAGVTAVAFSPDSQSLVTTSVDGTARLWDLTSDDPNQEFKILSGHNGPVTAAAFTPDGKRLVTAEVISPVSRWWELRNQNSTMQTLLWDPTKDDPNLSKIPLKWRTDFITSLTISPDGHWLVTGSGDATRLWNLKLDDPNQDESPIVLGGHTDWISAVAISPDSHWLVTGSNDRTARLWDLKDLTPGEPADPSGFLDDHQGRISDVGFSPDGHWLVTSSDDKTARLWNLAGNDDPVPPSISLLGHEGSITNIAISPDDHWLVTGSQDRTARLWDLKSFDPTSSSVVLSEHDDRITTLAIDPDSRWLVTGGGFRDQTARLWDLATADPSSPFVLEGHKGGVTVAAFSPDKRWLVTAASRDKTAQLWDLAPLQKRMPPTSVPLVGHDRPVTAAAFSPDGRWLVTGSDDNTARLWDLNQVGPETPSRALEGNNAPITALAIDPDSRWLVTAGADGTALLWGLKQMEDDSPTPSPTKRLKKPEEGIDPEKWSAHGGRIDDVGFSPNKHWLVTVSWDGTARLWDMSAEEPAVFVTELAGHESLVRTLAFTSDSRWLATGSNDSTVRLWDLENVGPEMTPTILTGYEAPITKVVISSDDRWLAAGGISTDDRWLAAGGNRDAVRLWDLKAEERDASAVVLTGHTDRISALAISPDNRWLVTGSFDKTVRLWDLSIDDLLARARRCAGRELTPEEKRMYGLRDLDAVLSKQDQ